MRQILDLVPLVRDTATLLGSHEHTITITAPDVLWLHADPDRLRQVLDNLLSNALRYSPAGVPVVVQVRTDTVEDRAMAVLLVQDQGRGIAPAVLPHIFERFHAGADSSGLGLGLYLTYAMVTAHGGTLRVDSQVGQGTTFTLRLPLLPSQPNT